MKKNLFIVCCVFCVVLIISAGAITANNYQFVAYQANYDILINGEFVVFDAPLIRADNRIYVSLRELSEFLGYEVLYMHWGYWGGQISLQDEENRERLLVYTSFQGTLPNGVKYQFYGRDGNIFDLNRYKENRIILERYELSEIAVARTPSEAAEIGYRHLGVIFGAYDRVIVYYCPETDNWIIGTSGRIPPGRTIPIILAINRTTGSMVRYVSER